MKTVDARTLAKWRRWLAGHHDSESEAWLIFYKQHTGIAGITYEARFARKFTPRKADSVWSDSNRTRYAKLKTSGRLQPSGVDRPPTNRRPEKQQYTMPAKLPRYEVVRVLAAGEKLGLK